MPPTSPTLVRPRSDKWIAGVCAAIAERFGISPARYYQLLARLVDDPAAMAYDPLMVRRLRRRRDERRNQRTARALGERTTR